MIKIDKFVIFIIIYIASLAKASFANISTYGGKIVIIKLFLYSLFINFSKSYKNILKPEKFNQTYYKIGSPYWENVRKHLRFVVSYYSLKDYFCSPAIRIVCSTNHQKLNVSKDFLLKNKIFANFAKIFCKNFSKTNYNAVIRNLSVCKNIYSIKFIKKKITKNLSCCEIGPGAGLNAFFYSTLNKNSIFFFDIPEMTFIQSKIYSFLSNKLRLNKVYFESNLKNLENKIYTKKYYISAFWSFSEFSVESRSKFKNLIKKSQFSLFCFNENFENVDNKKYFSELAGDIEKKIKFFPLRYYKMPKYAKKHKLCLIF